MFPGAFKLKSQSYLYGSSSLSSGASSGTYDITNSHSLNFLKQFIWWSSPAGVWEGNYAGVCPNLSTWQLRIGSTAYPQQPVKADRPSECFIQIKNHLDHYIAHLILVVLQDTILQKHQQLRVEEDT